MVVLPDMIVGQSWVQDLTALIVTFVLTGWLLGLVLVRDRLGIVQRTWLSMALSVPATILISVPGLALHRLGVPSFGLGLGLLLAVAAWRCRASLPGILKSWSRPSIPTPERTYILRSLGLVAAIVISWLAVLQPQIAGRRDDLLPLNRWVWYYIYLVRATVAERGLPATIVEWGEPRPFPVQYLAATLHGAITATLSGGADVELLENYRVFVVVLGLLSLYALWSRWLPAWWAWMASILTLSAARFANRFVAYWPETLALVLVIWSCWLFDQALARRSVRWMVLASVVSASAFLAHAEAWLLTGPLWVGISVSRLIEFLWSRKAKTTSVTTRRAPTRHDPAWPRLARMFGAGALTFSLLVAVSSVLSGDAGRLVELVSNEAVASAPSSDQAGSDPTVEVYRAMFWINPQGRPPTDYCSDMFRVHWSRFPYAGVDVFSRATRGVISLAVIGMLTALPLLPWRTRRALFVLGIYFITLYLGSRTFCAVYDTYIPRRAGPTRVMPYYSMALAGLLSTFGYLLAARLFRISRRVYRALSGAWLTPRVTASVVAAVVSIPLLVAFTPITQGVVRDQYGGPGPAAYEAYVWMSEHLPEDAVVLVNGYTAGTFGAISDRTGLLDGRGPYQEVEEWRDQAIQALVNARQYFTSPSDVPPPAVDYVVAGENGVNMGGTTFPVNIQALMSTRDLRLVRTFGSERRVYLFEVVQ